MGKRDERIQQVYDVLQQKLSASVFNALKLEVTRNKRFVKIILPWQVLNGKRLSFFSLKGDDIEKIASQVIGHLSNQAIS